MLNVYVKASKESKNEKEMVRQNRAAFSGKLELFEKGNVGKMEKTNHWSPLRVKIEQS